MPEMFSNWILANAAKLVAAVVLVAVWLRLRSRVTPHDPAAGLEGLLAGGAPVVVQLFENG